MIEMMKRMHDSIAELKAFVFVSLEFGVLAQADKRRSGVLLTEDYFPITNVRLWI